VARRLAIPPLSTPPPPPPRLPQAGQQRFHVITQAYYRGAHGIVLVYDASDASEESFRNVRYWMDNIGAHATPGVVKALLGNKIDVKGKKVRGVRGGGDAGAQKQHVGVSWRVSLAGPSTGRRVWAPQHAPPNTHRRVSARLLTRPACPPQVESARGRALADAYGALFFEASAKDGTGVRDAFHTVAAAAVANLPAEGGGGAQGGGGAAGVKQLKGGASAGGGGKDGASGSGGGKDKDGKDCVVM
jgi:hypothetical protein